MIGRGCPWCGGLILGDDGRYFEHAELHALAGDPDALAYVLDDWTAAAARVALALREVS